MPIPNYQDCMYPILKLLSKHDELKFTKLISMIGDWFKLSGEEKNKMLTSGRSTILRTRVHWAKVYLKQAGLVKYPQRGYVALTSRGNEVLASNPESINTDYLKQFSEFVDFLNRSKSSNQDSENSDKNSQESPEEILSNTYNSIKDQVTAELLDEIKFCTPQFFEELVVKVIVAMGYGGSFEEAHKAIGKVGDEGVDGVIKEDRLGLDSIYLQAKLKRTDTNVGRPDVQKFYGALQGKRSKKGIFITTTDFSKEARDYANNIDLKIILISGQVLIDLMWEYNIGLKVKNFYPLKEIDYDFFVEE
ncbi:restriction endonuclease [Legionella septentrionalis]|uniref:restriction endonuclease n=1 Tax=Legionella septentrionalis TaxID=2498109 RepID=UPI000F8EE305|nr:restriction endonuclease [Legionella septentrionalis]RUR12524.1 restriction endonuclease [Legionella septentrionalis]